MKWRVLARALYCRVATQVLLHLKPRVSPYHGLEAVLVSNVSDGDDFSLGWSPGVGALGNYRCYWRIASKVAGRALLLRCDAVIGFVAENKNSREKQ